MATWVLCRAVSDPLSDVYINLDQVFSVMDTPVGVQVICAGDDDSHILVEGTAFELFDKAGIVPRA